jgi:hypothetical protein
MIATDLPAGLLADGATDAPGIKLLALVMGLLLIIAAIRAMFGKKKR